MSKLSTPLSKCAVFHDRRSGDSWYKSRKSDVPEVIVQSNTLPLCKRDYYYKYLRKSLSLCGEDETQIEEVMNKQELLVILPILQKKLSFLYYTTRIAFLVKMLNHDVEQILS